MFKSTLLVFLAAALAQQHHQQQQRQAQLPPTTTPIRGSWGLQAVDAESAWPLVSDKSEIVVAVIDTGVDVDHPDLASAIWRNPGEIPGNNIDDDGNGFVDDVNGWNFAHGNNRLDDNHGHGTHIAGIIGATGQMAIRGVAPHVRIMVLKYVDPKRPGADPLLSTVNAIEYAVRMGAKIINYSAGGKRPSKRERDAIEVASQAGILFVAAAGNESSDSDLKGYYPADYDLPNILSVTAVDPERRVLPSSNFGARTVAIAAPGERILSTLPKGKYGLMTGTSQATAFATGVAALLMANREGRIEPQMVAQALAMSGDVQPNLKFKTRYQTVLNAKRALVMHDRATSATGLVVEQAEMLDPRLLDPQL